MTPKELIENKKDKYNIGTPWARTREEDYFTMGEVWLKTEHVIIELMEDYAKHCIKNLEVGKSGEPKTTH